MLEFTAATPFPLLSINQYQKYMIKNIAFAVSMTVLLSGCNNVIPQKPPSNEKLAMAIASLYRLSLPNATIEQQTIIGKHFLPGTDSWNIVSCINIKDTENNPIKDCNNSFSLYKLDSEKWILDGKVNNESRWIEVADQ